ncbi:MAG: PepSY domain-containing protein [Lautropia sp.]|nr:PepSY domain-containing protein [Lautropia sp.]
MDIPFKRWTLLTHRWLGIGVCLLFFFWFISGMVMLYVGYPKLTYTERLQHLPVLTPDARLLSPRKAFAIAGIEDDSISDLRLSASRGGHPIYTAHLDGGPGNNETVVAVDAVSGQRLPPTDERAALDSARIYLDQERPLRSPGQLAPSAKNKNTSSQTPLNLDGLHYLGTVDEDPHTHSTDLNPHRPLHKVQLPDASHTLLYLSGTTGEVVRDAPRTERIFDYVGTWLHWLYMFRGGKLTAWWPSIVITVASIGVLVAITGSIVGILRWRFSRPYRSGSRSPFQPGIMRWHHIVGLLFALTTLTWIFSGLMSMRPWGLFANPAAELDTESISSLDIDPQDASAPPAQLLQLAQASGSRSDIRELQWRTLLNRPVVMAINTAGGPPEILDAISAQPVKLSEPQLAGALNALQPGHPPLIERLQQYDFYYYTRADHTMMGGYGPHPLPIWRVHFDDPNQTWVHIDPRTATVLGTLTQRGRMERWLFFLMHSWDLLPLLERRPVWDIIMLLLAAGGLILSATGTWIGIKRLGIKQRKWRHNRLKAARQ